MTDNILSADKASVAELWLLPEVESTHVIAVRDRGRKSGGFINKDGPVINSAVHKASLLMTEKRLDELKSNAEKEGFEAGREAGYQQGFAEGEKRANELAMVQQHSLNELLAVIGSEVTKESESLKGVLSDLVVKIARALYMRELERDSSIEQVVDQAVNALPLGEEHIKIYINPDDLKVLESIPEFIQPHWHLFADVDLERGGCLIKTAHSDVDFSLQQRIDAVVSQLFTSESAGDIGDQDKD